MSYLTESRQPRGCGIWITQFHPPGFSARGAPGGTTTKTASGWQVPNRPSIWFARVINRLDNGAKGELGHYYCPNRNVGDLNCSTFWRASPSRGCHGWAFAWPVAVLDSKLTNDMGSSWEPQEGDALDIDPEDNEDRGDNDFGGYRNKVNVRPLYDKWTDQRYQTLLGQVPDAQNFRGGDKPKPPWPKFPVGWIGVIISSTMEFHQLPLWHPTDPRTVAAHKEGDPEMGSWMCDLDASFQVDKTRIASYQSLFWVIKKPQLKNNAIPKDSNLIAVNFNVSGLQDCAGGLWIDKIHDFGGAPPGSAAKRVLGTFSWIWDGPLCTGTYRDDEKHICGEDEDGHRIVSGHIGVGTYYYKSYVYDAPLFFEEFVPQEIDHGTHRIMTHLEYYTHVDNIPARGEIKHNHMTGFKQGQWRWSTETQWGYYYSSNQQMKFQGGYAGSGKGPPPAPPGGP